MRRTDITARFLYVSEMLKAIEPLIDYYITEGGGEQRLLGFIEAKFDAVESEIEKKIASAK